LDAIDLIALSGKGFAFNPDHDWAIENTGGWKRQKIKTIAKAGNVKRISK
jgi:hypothetical protein